MLIKTLAAVAIASLLSVAAGAQTLSEAVKSAEHLGKAERRQFLLTQARKEGRVVWTTSTPAETVEPLVRGFREKYPGVPLEHFFASGRVLADRVIREYKAGKR